MAVDPRLCFQPMLKSVGLTKWNMVTYLPLKTSYCFVLCVCRACVCTCMGSQILTSMPFSVTLRPSGGGALTWPGAHGLARLGGPSKSCGEPAVCPSPRSAMVTDQSQLAFHMVPELWAQVLMPAEKAHLWPSHFPSLILVFSLPYKSRKCKADQNPWLQETNPTACCCSFGSNSGYSLTTINVHTVSTEMLWTSARGSKPASGIHYHYLLFNPLLDSPRLGWLI